MSYRSSPSMSIHIISFDSLPESGTHRNDPDTLGKIDEALSKGDVTDRVLSMTYEDSIVDNELDILKLRLDNRDFRFFEDPIWNHGNVVRIVFGYPGEFFGPKWMLINEIRGFTVLTVTCLPDTVAANVQRCKTWYNTNVVSIIEDIVAEKRILGVTNAHIDEEQYGRLLPLKDFNQTGMTDWQFLNQLASDMNYDVHIKGDTLHFHRPDYGRPPVRRYEYFVGGGEILDFEVKKWSLYDRAAVNIATGRDPIGRVNYIAVGSDAYTERTTLGSSGLLAKTATGRVGAQIGKAAAAAKAAAESAPNSVSPVEVLVLLPAWSKQELAPSIVGSVPSEAEEIIDTHYDSPDGGTTAQRQLANAETFGAGSGVFGGVSTYAGATKIDRRATGSPTDLKATADASYRSQEDNEIEVTMKILGDPSLTSEDLIEVVGISKLSGTYRVVKVTHDIGSGGYTSILELRSNSTITEAQLTRVKVNNAELVDLSQSRLTVYRSTTDNLVQADNLHVVTNKIRRNNPFRE